MDKTTISLLDAFASIATILGFIVVIVSAIIALKSLKEMKDSRNLEGMLRIYDQIGSDEAREERSYVYNRLTKNPEKITPEDKKIIDSISTSFDRIGTLVKYNLVQKELLLDGHHTIFMNMWELLEPHIIYRRNKDTPYHASNFQWFANLCKEYHLKTYADKS